LPGKTIIFAMTKMHAHRIAEVFEEMYPQHVGVVQVITSTTERVRDGSYGDGLITKFKKNNLPRIAISVDMLDTGIDVPEAVNLVFMKPVQSRIKLWQMIGRGTRNQEACKYLDRLPGGKKTEFKIIDFWQNDFNKKADDKPAIDIPVLVSVFNTRLKILERHIPDQTAEAFRQAITDLRGMMTRIPRDSFPVKKVWLQVAPAWEDDFWTLITPAKLDFLRLHVSPLLRFAADVDVAAETFTHKIERLKLQILQATPSPQLLQSIAEDVSLLPDIAERVRSCPSAALALSAGLATATPAQLTQIIRDLAPQMKNRRDRPSGFLKIDLPDFIATRGYISVGEGGHQILIEEYKRRVDSRVLEIVEKDPAIAALREGREVTDEQLVDLERTLHRELARDDIQLSSRNMRIAYGLRVDNFLAFLRHLLALDAIPDYRQLVQRGFERHIQAHNYNAEQIRFLRSVQEVFLAKRTKLVTFFTLPNRSRPKPCSPILHSVPRSKLSGTSSGPAGCPIPSTPSSNCPFCSSSNDWTSASRTASALPNFVARSSRPFFRAPTSVGHTGLNSPPTQLSSMSRSRSFHSSKRSAERAVPLRPRWKTPSSRSTSPACSSRPARPSTPCKFRRRTRTCKATSTNTSLASSTPLDRTASSARPATSSA
jgi:type I restriction enzyme R subunit